MAGRVTALTAALGSGAESKPRELAALLAQALAAQLPAGGAEAAAVSGDAAVVAKVGGGVARGMSEGGRCCGCRR